MDKILICGPRGVGKSTLIRRLAALYPGPVSGFVTKRLTTADGEGMFPIYIHPAAQPEDRRQYGPENLAGRCDSRRSARYTPVFDEWGPRLLAGPGLLVMDELGFLERDASRFQAAVLAALRGPQPVLAAVKNRDDPFLRAVRSVPGVRVLYITRDNPPGRGYTAPWPGSRTGRIRLNKEDPIRQRVFLIHAKGGRLQSRPPESRTPARCAGVLGFIREIRNETVWFFSGRTAP